MLNSSEGSSGSWRPRASRSCSVMSELLLGVSREILLDQVGGEVVEAGSHRRVRREDVPRPRGGEGHLEGLAALLHEVSGTLQRREGRMPLVQMADIRPYAEGPEQLPAAYPEHELLLQAQLGSTSVELAGDGSAPGRSPGRCCRGGRVSPGPPAPAMRAATRSDLGGIPRAAATRRSAGGGARSAADPGRCRDRGPAGIRPCRSSGGSIPAG